MSNGRLTQLINIGGGLDNSDGSGANAGLYYLSGRLRGLADYPNTPQARRMMHVVIRNLADELENIVNERFE